MGLDVTARIIVGEKFVEKSITKKTVKYDENTGEPYVVKEKESIYVLATDATVLMDESAFVKDFGFYYSVASDREARECIMGLKLCEVDLRLYKHLEEIDLDILLEARTTYRRVMEREAFVWTQMYFLLNG